jgi:hypothetical protein
MTSLFRERGNLMSRLIKFLCIFLLFGSLFFQVSEVDAATKLVVVNGTIYKGKAPITKGLVTTYAKGTTKVYHSTIKNGKFQLSVPAGEYTVHSYRDDAKGTVGNIYQNVTVLNAKSVSTVKILLKEDNIKGSIQPSSGKIADGTIYFLKHDRGATNYFSVIRNNQFQLPLADGKYTAYQYINKSKKEYVQLDYTFTVVKGKLAAPLKIKEKPANVLGSVQIPAQKNINGTVKMVCQSCTLPTTYTATIKKGLYKASLPNGQFKVASVYNESTKKTNKSSFVFEVKAEKVEASKESMKVVVGNDNVKGSIEKGGKPIAKGNIYIEPRNGEGFFYYPEIKDGKFTTFLKDGSYEIHAYYDGIQQQIVPLETPIPFVVSGGKSSPRDISIQLHADNLIGTVYKAGKAIGKGTLFVPIGNVTRLVSVVNGRFTAYLADGTYTIRMARDEITYLEHEFEPITVTVKDGKLSSSSPLNINILEDNVTGTFMTGSGLLGNGAFYVSDGNGKKYKFPIHNGVFSMLLPDGTYVVGDVFDYQDGGTKVADFSFTVKGGKLVSGPLKIQVSDKMVPEKNFSGTLVKSGDAIKMGTIILHAGGGKYFTVPVTDNKYSAHLSDGAYWVQSVYDQTNNVKYEPGVAFTIEKGKLVSPVTIEVKEHNVQITVENKMKFLTGSLQLVDHTGKMFPLYIQEGRLSTYMPDGEYKIIAFYTESNVQMPLLITFSVKDGKADQELIKIVIPE